MQARSGKAANTAALIIAIVALAVAIFGVVYRQQVSTMRDSTVEQEALYQRMTGLDNPAARNALDPRYTDADGDLVADAPTNASKQIDPPTLKFSYVVVDDDSEFRTAFKDLLAAISTATGKPVEYVTYNSVEDELRALRDGQLHIAGLNTGSVPIAVCTAGFVPVSLFGEADGTPGYHMQIIARPDSPISKLADIRGHELALTEPNSNSGYKAPLVRLREINLRPPTDYLIRYSQGHVQSIAGIKNKTFEAAAVAGDVLKRETNEGHISTNDYKVVYTSDELFPGAAVGYGSTLKPELAAKIKGVLNNFDWKGTGLEKSFAAEGKTKFVPADYKKQWDFVRRIDESIGFVYALREPASSQPTSPTTQAAALPASTQPSAARSIVIDASRQATIRLDASQNRVEFDKLVLSLDRGPKMGDANDWQIYLLNK